MSPASQEALAATIVEICRAITAPLVAEIEGLKRDIAELRDRTEAIERSARPHRRDTFRPQVTVVDEL
jgi:hypothetical protein